MNKKKLYIAKTMQGLEDLLAKELQSLGATHIHTLRRAVEFKGDLRLLYRANLELRTALRILVPICDFNARNEQDLYREIRKIDWARFLSLEQTFAIDAVTNSQTFNHSRYAALKTKDAIADHFRHKTGQRPSVDIRYPNLRLHLHIRDQHCSLSLDSSGRSLNQRGYRVQGGVAPINEVLAAGMILLSGWKADSAFVDPMCGSGTLPIEAALYAWNIPPQIKRDNLGFLRWKDFDRDLWQTIQEEALERQRDFHHPILGSDSSFKALKTARANVLSAYLEDKVEIRKEKFENLTPPPPPGLLITNPPYDERLALEDAEESYKEIGDILKQHFTGYQAWIISGHPSAWKRIGLKTSRRLNLMNGPIECKYLGYKLYSGSNR
jgi:putative N6-adenine-specific DNA methylase